MGKGQSGFSNSIMGINTDNLSGVQINALEYFEKNGTWPSGLSSYQKSKLGGMIEEAQGLPKASSYKDNGLSRDAAEKKFKDLYNSTPHTKAEEAAKNEYITSADDINAALRGQGSYDKGTINTLRKSMTINNNSSVLYRGLNGSRLGIKQGDTVADVRKKLLGKVRADKGFASSSMSIDVAKEFSARGINEYYPGATKAMMVINPKGAKTTLIKSGLSEVVFDAGTKLQYTDIKKKGDIYFIYARVHK